MPKRVGSPNRSRDNHRSKDGRAPGAATEPIAIVGLHCRLPGAKDPEAFWQLLSGGVDAITEVPADRWDVDAYYDPRPGIPGKANTRWGGFVDDLYQFDAQFFGISPREAIFMDPQQRLLLEVAWAALENAAQPPDKLAGSQTGVFIGMGSVDYALCGVEAGYLFDNPHILMGAAHSIAANRLSYFFDFRGPSVAVDTACSSSLVTVHLACRSLWSGESTLALAGGVHLNMFPGTTVTFSHARMMAPDGRCKVFDAKADGYVRGEGCAVLVIKRASDALRDGDH